MEQTFLYKLYYCTIQVYLLKTHSNSLPNSTFICSLCFRTSRIRYYRIILQHSERQHTNNILVIGEFNFRYIQSFAAIQFLFVLQNIVVKEFLQFFVTIVDTELFKRIDREILYLRENKKKKENKKKCWLNELNRTNIMTNKKK